MLVKRDRCPYVEPYRGWAIRGVIDHYRIPVPRRDVPEQRAQRSLGEAAAVIEESILTGRARLPEDKNVTAFFDDRGAQLAPDRTVTFGGLLEAIAIPDAEKAERLHDHRVAHSVHLKTRTNANTSPAVGVGRPSWSMSPKLKFCLPRPIRSLASTQIGFVGS